VRGRNCCGINAIKHKDDDNHKKEIKAGSKWNRMLKSGVRSALVPFSLSFGATSAAAVKHIRETSSASLERILGWRVRVVHSKRSSLQMKPPAPGKIERPGKRKFCKHPVTACMSI